MLPETMRDHEVHSCSKGLRVYGSCADVSPTEVCSTMTDHILTWGVAAL